MTKSRAGAGAATPIAHATFAMERTYPQSAPRIFAAFSNSESKRAWFAEGDGWIVESFEADFRVGGREVSRFRLGGGPLMSNDTCYQDIVEDQRLVFVYTMAVEGRRISSSLASIELFPQPHGTRLLYTEQGQFFDGRDQAADRKKGCEELFGRLGQILTQHETTPT